MFRDPFRSPVVHGKIFMLLQAQARQLARPSVAHAKRRDARVGTRFGGHLESTLIDGPKKRRDTKVSGLYCHPYVRLKGPSLCPDLPSTMRGGD